MPDPARGRPGSSFPVPYTRGQRNETLGVVSWW